jgi:signal transduction histidine kinase
MTSTEPPISSSRVLFVAALGFSLVVGLVLLAAYLGYRGSTGIDDTVRELLREHLLQSERGAQLGTLIEHETQDLLDRLNWVLGLCFLLAAGTAVLTLGIIRRAFTRLEWQSAELSRVSWHLLDSQEKIARRFSHEIHDELGQALTSLRRMLTRAPNGNFDAVRPDCVAIVDEVLEDVRKLSQMLRPVILDDFGLDSSLLWLCERFTQRTQIPVAYQSTFHQRLDEAEETHLFRIAQEALTNVARHAEATEVSVALSADEQTLRLEIKDNGRGLQPPAGEKNPSLGMVGMRARARQLGGELTVESPREGGLRIRVEVPLRLRPGQEETHEQENPSFVG